ncbi:MAG: glycosyltransferase, partial [Candidatus Pacebacteria bacterium]|nr:glycosyltransferase [Candidatus Paceibacterota bacterium]
PFSFDLDKFKDNVPARFLAREKYKIPRNAFVVGMVGRIVRQKDPETFVRAASMISEKIPEARFVWVGEGDLKQEITVLLEKSKLKEKFVITGQIPNEEVPQLLSAIDVFLFTSLFEGLPISLIEAMSAALPIVAARVGGIPELIVEGDTGLLFQRGNAKEAAEKVLEFFHNETLRKQCSENARRRAEEQFSPADRCSRNFGMLYQRLLQDHI